MGLPFSSFNFKTLLFLMLLYAAPSLAELTDVSYNDVLSHPSPYIPAQCYTAPKISETSIANPCYACHTPSKRPNVLNDTDVQLVYGFPDSVLQNPWTNLFKDRRDCLNQGSGHSRICTPKQLY